MKNEKIEKGQILYIVAIAMVALMAFTALAIDGGNVFRERRKDQSTADSAALAAAGAAAQYLKTQSTSNFVCSTDPSTISGKAIVKGLAAAQASATSDNVTLDTNLSANNGIVATCDNENGVDYLDFHAVVSSSVDTYFLKVITNKPNTSVVDAMTRVYVNTMYADGNALVSMGTDCSTGGIHALGNGQVRVSNGGIYSTSCYETTGSSKIINYKGIAQYNTTLSTDWSTLVLNDPDNTAATSAINLGLTPMSSQPAAYKPVKATQALTPMQIPAMTKISAPACGASRSKTNPTGSGDTLYPGTYSSLSWGSWGSGNLTFTPGVYCFTGPVSFSGGGGSATVIMNGSTLYFYNGAGGLNLSSANIRYQISNSTVYIENGDYGLNNPNITANNSKIYIGTGGVTMAANAQISMNDSSIYLNNGTFDVTAGATFNAEDITIYIKQGNFVIEGGAIVNMYAPGCNTSACGVGPAIPGVLLLMDPNYSHNLNIDNGTGTAHVLNGTMYAPTATASLSGGTSTTTLNVQLIAQKISVIAGAVLNMNIDNARLYSQASTVIELLK